MNYSRSYWFNFLPAYHMGVRAKYKFGDVMALTYGVTNGTQEVEPFNNFKDQFVAVAVQPAKAVTWNAQYYFGQERPDVVPVQAPVAPTLPTQPGLSITPVSPYYAGKLHIFDSYMSWAASAGTTLGRSEFSSAPFFLTRDAGILSTTQNSLTLGLIWWWGTKRDAW